MSEDSNIYVKKEEKESESISVQEEESDYESESESDCERDEEGREIIVLTYESCDDCRECRERREREERIENGDEEEDDEEDEEECNCGGTDCDECEEVEDRKWREFMRREKEDYDSSGGKFLLQRSWDLEVPSFFIPMKQKITIACILKNMWMMCFHQGIIDMVSIMECAEHLAILYTTEFTVSLDSVNLERTASAFLILIHGIIGQNLEDDLQLRRYYGDNIEAYTEIQSNIMEYPINKILSYLDTREDIDLESEFKRIKILYEEQTLSNISKYYEDKFREIFHRYHFRNYRELVEHKVIEEPKAPDNNLIIVRG